MYQAPIVVGLIFGVWIWKKIAHRYSEANPTKQIPMMTQYFVPLYAIIFVLLCMAMRSAYSDVMVVSNWLNGDETKDFVRSVMESSDIDRPSLAEGFDGTGAYQTWASEADVSAYPLLKMFSMTTPFWCIGTFVVCVHHTYEHLKQVKANHGNNLHKAHEHDATISILVLPMIYGLMSFKSVIRCWQICINHIPAPPHGKDSGRPAVMFNGYEERKSFLLEMYGANFEVGDIYETIALVTFGYLVTGVLKKKMRDLKNIVAESGHPESKEEVDKLTDSLSTLTVAGIQLFGYACFISGMYNVIITTMGFSFPNVLPQYFSRSAENPGLLQKESTKAAAEMFFLGCSTVASCAAIGNVMIIEEDFASFLEDFSPKAKFWGTKVLVSLACLQSMLLAVLPPFSSWSTVKVDLFYAAVLCMECFFIALFHRIGWAAHEGWYKPDGLLKDNQEE